MSIETLPVYDVEELPLEYVHLTAVNEHTAELQELVDQQFDGDWGQAVREAQCLVNQYINPPQWALDIAGPRKGWTDPARRKF